MANAGYAQRGGLELSNDDFERMWQVHVMAHVYGARAVLPSMIARGEGYILTTASAAGLLTQMDSVTYAITKHGAVALAEWLAINHHHQGIRVSVLCPQAVRTNILGSRAAADSAGARQAGQDGMLEPDQLADTVIEALPGGALLGPAPPRGRHLRAAQGRRRRPLAGRHAPLPGPPGRRPDPTRRLAGPDRAEHRQLTGHVLAPVDAAAARRKPRL